jgi:hypothetical protein
LTSLPGFSIADPDLVTVTTQEVDFMRVIVRLLNSDDSAFGAGNYADVHIDVTAGGAAIDADHDGNGDFLVLQGTRADVNAALSTLKVSFSTDRDQTYKVQVIADDRVRDGSGNLVDRDGSTAGLQPGGNGGGTLNEPDTLLTGTPQVVPSTEYNWYTDAVPTSGTIVGNISDQVHHRRSGIRSLRDARYGDACHCERVAERGCEFRFRRSQRPR